MNSLNLLSARVIGTSSSEKSKPSRPRSYSEGNVEKVGAEGAPVKRSASQHVKRGTTPEWEDEKEVAYPDGNEEDVKFDAVSEKTSETSPLLAESKSTQRPFSRYSKLRLVTKRLVDALTASLQWVLSALVAPGVYLFSGLYDEKGHFSPSTPVRKLNRLMFKRNGRKSIGQAVGLSGSPDASENAQRQARRAAKRRSQEEKRMSSANSESEADIGEKMVLIDRPPDSRAQFQSSSESEDAPQTRRSIRIKLYNEDSTRRRNQRRGKGDTAAATGSDTQPALTVANIKSPTSPTSSLRMTKYPRSPAPPRPLIPRRQPSYSSQPSRSSRLQQKTLVIDLDETLIHSLAKGGRMSSGHMVEVKLNTTVGYGGATLGPQHPILYYVHKRPHCDDFLRRVCKWYNLVVFTASVQEYADPVIDWLEQERKYFSGRYYRQHCTYRNGAYIKDLSSVEPDLSNVMILDNSPLSYIFHEGTRGVLSNVVLSRV